MKSNGSCVRFISKSHGSWSFGLCAMCGWVVVQIHHDCTWFSMAISHTNIYMVKWKSIRWSAAISLALALPIEMWSESTKSWHLVIDFIALIDFLHNFSFSSVCVRAAAANSNRFSVDSRRQTQQYVIALKWNNKK